MNASSVEPSVSCKYYNTHRKSKRHDLQSQLLARVSWADLKNRILCPRKYLYLPLVPSMHAYVQFVVRRIISPLCPSQQDVQCFSRHSEEPLCATSTPPFISCSVVFTVITGLSFCPLLTTHTPVALLQVSSGQTQPTRHTVHCLSVQVSLKTVLSHCHHCFCLKVRTKD